MVTVSKIQVSRDLNCFLCKIILQSLFFWQCVAVSEDRGTLEELGVLGKSSWLPTVSILLRTDAQPQGRVETPAISCLVIAHILQVRFAGRESS